MNLRSCIQSHIHSQRARGPLTPSLRRPLVAPSRVLEAPAPSRRDRRHGIERAVTHVHSAHAQPRRQRRMRRASQHLDESRAVEAGTRGNCRRSRGRTLSTGPVALVEDSGRRVRHVPTSARVQAHGRARCRHRRRRRRRPPSCRHRNRWRSRTSCSLRLALGAPATAAHATAATCAAKPRCGAQRRKQERGLLEREQRQC